MKISEKQEDDLVKLSKSEKKKIEKDLIDNISLVIKDDNMNSCTWVDFDELKSYYKHGYVLFNEFKRQVYESKYVRR